MIALTKYGSDQSGYEILHIFSNPLPYGWYMPLVPVRFLNKNYDDLLGIYRKYLVVRQQTLVYVDEYSVPTPVIDFMAINYTQMNVAIAIEFGRPPPTSLRVRRVQDIGVTNVYFRKLPNSIEVRVPKLRRGETIKITW